MKNRTINVKGSEIAVSRKEQEDYISLTDIARYRDAERTDYIIQNWLRNHNTIEFLGIWKQLNNTGFKPIEFDGFRKQAGLIAITQMKSLSGHSSLKQLADSTGKP